MNHYRRRRFLCVASYVFLSFTKMKRLFPFLCVLLLGVACTSEDYDTGDGDLSYLRADFSDVYSNGKALLVSAMTDEGDSLLFRQQVKTSWTTTPDSCYRALLYYNKVKGQADVMSVKSVLVPSVRERSADKPEEIKEDPVKVIGAWVSTNGRYLNLDLELMTGKDDGEVVSQTVGVYCDSVVTDDSGRQHVALSLYHDQNNCPEYYSAEVYMSIPLARIPCALRHDDEVTFRINTYSGTWLRTFTIGQ